jgi:hypothetical protein
MAAVLASGPGAVLTHRSVAAHWELLPTARRGIDVTVDRALRPRDGIDAHRSHLPAGEVTVHRGIPVTTVARTLLDLAAVVPRERLERAINEAEVRGLTDHVPLIALLTRYPRRRGIATLRAILATGWRGTRSELEDRFLAYLRDRNLPMPEANARIFAGGEWLECDWCGGRSG